MTENVVKEEKKTKDPSKELVKHTFFYDGDKYKSAIPVIVNGKSYQIRRGVEVTLPKFVFDIAMESEASGRATAKLMADLARE